MSAIIVTTAPLDHRIPPLYLHLSIKFNSVYYIASGGSRGGSGYFKPPPLLCLPVSLCLFPSVSLCPSVSLALSHTHAYTLIASRGSDKFNLLSLLLHHFSLSPQPPLSLTLIASGHFQPLGQAPLLFPPPEDTNLAGRGDVGGRDEADGHAVCAGPLAVAAVAAAGKRVSAICRDRKREREKKRESERGR